MSTRTALTVVGGVVGAYFGYPQLGLVVGGLIGGIVDPTIIPGPKIGEISVQTSADDVPRPIIYGAMACYGNVIQTGQAVKVEGDDGGGKGEPEQATGDQVYRTYAIRVCEGPIAAYLRVWEDNKLVYDFRAGSQMLEESLQWSSNKVFYLGDESQLPDPTLVASVNADSPSYRGTAYVVFNTENLTNRIGAIPQYRFEVAISASSGDIGTVETVSDNGTFYTDIATDADGNLLMLEDQVGDTPHGVFAPPNGSFTINKYSKDDLSLLTSTIVENEGDSFEPGADQRMGIIGISSNGIYFSATGDGTNASNRTLSGGVTIGHLLDNNGNRNWGPESANGTPVQYGGLIFFHGGSLFMGINRSTYNKILKWTGQAGSPDVSPSNALVNPVTPDGGGLAMHVSRAGVVRAVSRAGWSTINEYDLNLSFTGTRAVPAGPWLSASHVLAFGIDEDKDLQVYIYEIGFAARVAIFNLAGTLLSDQFIADPAITDPGVTKILFTDDNIWFMRFKTVYRVEAFQTYTPHSAVLSDIVSDIHDRCGIDSSMYDVSELTNEVAGFMLAGEYTGADAINSPKLVYFYDKSEHDKALYYPKRGAAVIETLSIDDLTEVPDTTIREQAIEIPKKLHLRYQHANSGYPPVKATVVSSSPDILTTGEVSIEVPIVLDEDEAIQTADKMYKVTRAELYGTTDIVVPLYVGAKYVTGNCIGLSLRGSTKRMRIEEITLTPDWQMRLSLRPDRQSAYTSNLTGVPIPEPTPPPSTIIGATELAILDISARSDSEDDLNYLVAVSGRLSPWYGARYQRSFDGGATWTTVQDITTASIMGELIDAIPSASEYLTDTTNEVTVSLYRSGQELSSITEAEFLSEGNGFALEKDDGSWEVMQFQNANENSDGTWTLTTLHRGQLNSAPSAHSSGAKFVMLQRPTHITAQSSWIGQSITHRAISLGESSDDTINDVTLTYEGRSQIEWPVASFDLDRDGSTVTSTWNPRHRFGSDDAPVASVNFQGYRASITDGVTPETFDTTTPSFTRTYAASVDVTVASLNRITGEGPTTAGSI